MPNGENSRLYIPSGPHWYPVLQNTSSRCIDTEVYSLADFWGLFWHFGYLEMYAIDNHCMMSVFVNKVIWKVGKYKYIVLEINNKHIVGQKQDYGSAQIILENAINDFLNFFPSIFTHRHSIALILNFPFQYMTFNTRNFNLCFNTLMWVC